MTMTDEAGQNIKLFWWWCVKLKKVMVELIRNGIIGKSGLTLK